MNAKHYYDKSIRQDRNIENISFTCRMFDIITIQLVDIPHA